MTYEQASKQMWDAYHQGITVSIEQVSKDNWRVVSPTIGVHQTASTQYNVGCADYRPGGACA